MATIRERTWITRSGEERSAWIADFFDASGTRRMKTFKLKKDADRFLVTARHQIAQGVYTPESTSITVQQAADHWLEHGRSRGLERATVLMMEQHVAHLMPLIGKERLAKLSRPRVEQLADTLRRNYSAAMAKKILQSFKGIMREAMRRGTIASNPAADVRIETNGRHRPKLRIGIDVPTPGEIEALLAAASDDPKWRAFLALAAYCGLRASELRALAWSSVALGKHPTVTVSERADRYSSIGSPKSASGRRTIPLGEVTAQALKEWRLAQPPGRTLVFGNSRDNPEHLANIHARVLVPLQKRAGIRRYSLHSLRHYAISRWLAAGLDLKLCQTLAGHGSLSLTLDRYGHWISRHDDHARVAAVETAGFTN